MIHLSTLEKEVMEMLLQGSDATLQILAGQFRNATVAQRTSTGSGFFITFQIPGEATRLPDQRSFHFGDVHAEVGGLDNGAGFVLRISDGVIDSLEGYSYEELWPPTIACFELSYIGGPSRDLEKLRKSWTT